MNNKTNDIYGLVAEMEKNKKKESMKVDDVFNMIDNLQNIEVEDVKNTVNSMNNNSSNTSNLDMKDIAESRIVNRPTLPKPRENFDSRYNCFMDMITNVDYGKSNSQEYVKGHKEALKKCILQAENNPNNLQMVEALVNDESSRVSTSNLYFKGYKDGLTYAHQALKYSKASIMDKIYKNLRNNL